MMGGNLQAFCLLFGTNTRVFAHFLVLFSGRLFIEQIPDALLPEIAPFSLEQLKGGTCTLNNLKSRHPWSSGETPTDEPPEDPFPYD